MNAEFIESLLDHLPDGDRERLFPLLTDGPAIVEALTGHRPRTRMTTARWLLEHWFAVDTARHRASSGERE